MAAPVCGYLVKQTDGTYLLGVDPAAADLSACAYIVEGGSGNNWRELGNMSIANAEQIGVAVGVVWAIAWGFRAIAKSLSNYESSES